MKKYTICFAVAISIINLGFISEISAQTLGFSACLDENDAFVGLDRKGWTSQTSKLSESFQFDFEIPDPSPLDCHKVSFINVSISFDETTNNIPPNCIGGFWTHALACDSNDPIDCPTSTILYDEMGLNSNFTLTEELENGQNLGIDIVVLINVQDPTCDPASITAGLYEADIEVCIDVFYEPLEPEMEVDLGDDIIICDGETIDIDGPNGFESYEWDGPVNSDEQTLEDAIPGIYTLDAYDDLGCKSSDEIEILVDNEINIDLGSNNPLSICGDSEFNLSPSVNTIENNPDFDYEWTLPDNSNLSTSSINITQSGIYTLEVTDSDSECTSVIELSVQETDISQAQIDSINIPQVNICEGGSIDLMAFVPFNDLNNYAFEWINGTDTIRTQMFTVDQAGIYILNMYNQIGCPTSSDTITIDQISPLSAGNNNNATICTGEVFDLNSLLSNDAETDGIWFDDNSMPITNGLYTTNISNDIVNITYVVSNDLPCMNATAFFTLFVNDENINAGSDQSIELCINDNINLSDLQNGDAGGDYFDNSFTILSNSMISSGGLSFGINIYYYIVSGNTCGQDTAILNLNVLDEIAPTLIEGPFCNSDEVIVGTQIFNASNTTGTVILSSENNCDSIIEVDMMFYAIAESIVEQTYCASEIVIIEGEMFDSSNSSDIITLAGESINGCDSIINVDLQFVDAIESFFDQELCEGESITIGGQIFDQTNTNDIITLINGSSLGCDSILTVDLTFTSVINGNITEKLCSGEEIEINGEIFNESNDTGQQNFTSVLGCDSLLTIEIMFLDNSASAMIVDLCEGEEIDINGEIFNDTNLTSEQIILNSVGCDSTINISINLIPLSINTISTPLCEGESITVEGEVFDVNNTSGTITIANGATSTCDSIINIDLIFNQTYNMNITNDLCIGDSVFINGVWEFDSGNFEETLTSIQGCDSITTYLVNFRNCEIEIDFEIVETISCSGSEDGQVDITFLGELVFPYTYEVVDAQTNVIDFTGQITSDKLTLPNLSSKDYIFNLISQGGDLINSVAISLTQPQELAVSFTIDDVLCLGESTGNLNLQVTGGTQPYSYLWSNGSTELMINQLSTGTYSYTVTDTNGCDIQGSISIIEPDAITATLIVTNTNCENISNGSIEVVDVQGGTPDYNYAIDAYNFTTENIFENLSIGAYQVFITDANGCLEQFNTMIDFEPSSSIDEINDFNITLGDSISVVLNLDFTPTNVSWLSAETISCNDCLAPTFFPTTTTTYTVEVQDEFGCLIEQSFTINVLIPDNDQVYVPTVFTPDDQTGGNNLFRPFFSADANVTFLRLDIYDRWGNRIYEESNVLVGWDGRSKTGKINQGVYVYVITYIDNNGISQIMAGDITLLR